MQLISPHTLRPAEARPARRDGDQLQLDEWPHCSDLPEAASD